MVSMSNFGQAFQNSNHFGVRVNYFESKAFLSESKPLTHHLEAMRADALIKLVLQEFYISLRNGPSILDGNYEDSRNCNESPVIHTRDHVSGVLSDTRPKLIPANLRDTGYLLGHNAKLITGQKLEPGVFVSLH
ncbi:hypothetical protein RRG08_062362 [Elysia crispata]|uniref:Uncharacterized protein n=1 Tax=Elysia crispata TaxID=231223 RepID=A0AAE0YG87_9GAST|nr:hypothetical protein RRG08_062362 [Elysia crispata]